MTKSIYTPEYRLFIEDLVHERQRLGLSQAEVARQMDMTQSDISKIEACERRLDVLELKRILIIYRVSSNTKLAEISKNFLGIK